MTRFFFILLCTSLFSAASWAGGPGRIEHAKVTHVEPIVRTLTHRIPVESCWQEEVPVYQETRYRRQESATSTVLGGIIGAAIGNAVGHKKSNKRVGAVAGALLGASIGSDLGRHHRGQEPQPRHTGYRTERRCEVSHDIQYEDQVIGYDVTYRYHGQTYTTRMDQHPGNKIPVRVQVRPIL